MSSEKSLLRENSNEEISALIEVLRKADQRLEELTGGEVDTVSGRDRRTSFVRRAQDRSRASEAAKQAAILNALPAHIVLLDTQGLIISLNEAWRRFAGANALQCPGYGIGLNYLDICDRVRGNGASEARQVADGIRSVLSGAVKHFSIEYPCHSPTAQRWFRLTVTPLAEEHPNGAVVMHLDVTSERQTKASLHASELRFRQMAESIRDVFFLVDADSNRMLYVSPAYEEIWGRTCESLYANPESWTEAFHPDDRESTYENYNKGMSAGTFEYEYRIVRPDGSIRWMETRGYPVRDDAGKIIRIAGVAADVTERKQIEAVLQRQRIELRVLFDLMPAMIWFKDTENRILRINQRAAETAGKPVEEIEGKQSLEIYPQQAARFYADDLEVIRSGVPKLGIVATQRDPEDKELWIQTDKIPYRDQDGKVIGIVVMTHDITGRKREEEALRESEERFSGAFEFAPIGVALVAPDGRWLKVNRALCDLVGYSEAELLTRTFQDITHPEDLEIDLENVRRMIAGEFRSYQMEKRYVHERGHFVTVLLNVSLVRDGQGEPLYFISQIQDITERKRTDEVVKRLAAIVENSADAIISNSLNGIVTSWNPAAEKMFGYTGSEIIGQPLQLLVPPDRLKEESEILAGFVRGELVQHLETVRIRKDGQHVDISATISPIKDPGGRIVGASKIVRDTTERKRASALLMENRQRLALATESAHIGIWDWDVVANKMVWDTQTYELYGIREQDSSGAYDAWQNGLHPEDRERAEAEITAALDGVKDFHSEFRVVWPNREVRDIEAYGLVQRASNGSATRMIGVNWDITGRKRAEIRIKYLNRVYAMLSDINTLIVRVRDRDELFRGACRIAVEEGGFRMSMIGIMDQSAKKIVPVASAGKEEEFLTAIKDLLSSTEGAPNTMVARAIREKKAVVSNDSQSDPRVLLGKKYAESGVRSMAVLPLIVSDEAVGVLALYSSESEFFHEGEMKLLTELTGDIAFAIDHIDKQERLDYLAYYDALTGLANRALFHERLQQSVVNAHEQGRKLALVLLDIERFKTINDTLGRPAGDALLKELAARLSVITGDVGRLARVDADHFAVMVTDVKSEEELARLIEQRIGEVFGPPFRIGGAELRVSTKVGIALFPADGADADALFRNAEAALKNAKAKGERYLFYTQTMNERVAEKLSMENNLRQALDKGEFVLHYQPKVNLTSGKLTSAEALLRWNDPRTGLVPPFQFIPILEETGLIHEVGRWALRKAIEDYLHWRAAGLAAVRIAVNVSPLQLRHRGFIAEIEQAIGIDPHAAAGLELEITESLIMEDVKHSIASLQAIRAMGVTIAIDDFGTGFSSLSYLSKLPVDTLKIDRSFVIDMTTGPQGLALVSTIINLAHSLKLKVVAEGVETEEQSRLLKLMSCDEMQGFLFSKPLPAEIFETRYLAPPPPG